MVMIDPVVCTGRPRGVSFLRARWVRTRFGASEFSRSTRARGKPGRQAGNGAIEACELAEVLAREAGFIYPDFHPAPGGAARFRAALFLAHKSVRVGTTLGTMRRPCRVQAAFQALTVRSVKMAYLSPLLRDNLARVRGQIGPIVSSDQQSCMQPCRLTRPKVGRIPTVPLRLEGPMMLPAVSVAMEKPTRPAAVADPDPDDDPAAPSLGFHGHRVSPRNQGSPPPANGLVASLAMSTAPAFSSRSATVNIGVFSELRRIATTSSSKIFDPRSIRSRCPFVGGSNEPG